MSCNWINLPKTTAFLLLLCRFRAFKLFPSSYILYETKSDLKSNYDVLCSVLLCNISKKWFEALRQLNLSWKDAVQIIIIVSKGFELFEAFRAWFRLFSFLMNEQRLFYQKFITFTVTKQILDCMSNSVYIV